MRTFNLVSTLCVLHAAAPLAALILVLFLPGDDPGRFLYADPFFTAIFCVVLAWPFWSLILPFANRGQPGQVVVPLVAGAVLWVLPAYLAATLISVGVR